MNVHRSAEKLKPFKFLKEEIQELAKSGPLEVVLSKKKVEHLAMTIDLTM